MYRCLVISLLLLLCTDSICAHSSWQQHADDMYEVFGFDESPELTAWMKYISSDLIDGYNKEKVYRVGRDSVGFYDYLKAKYPPFKCKHRVLFHWGYNSRPWNDILQSKVDSYHWSADEVKAFQQTMIDEQRRRNRSANARTERLFGFASSGKEAAQARALLSIAYDVHILGDYTPDNSDLDGLCSLSSVVGDLINNLRTLDRTGTQSLVSKIQRLSRSSLPDPEKSLSILQALKEALPQILRKYPDSRITRLFTTDK